MNYVIIGNSAAAIGAVEGIRQVDQSGQITIIADEPHHTYSRPLISYLLLGKTTREKMKYRADGFYEDNSCRFVYGRATKIDAAKKEVTVEVYADQSGNPANQSGNNPQFIKYDKLLVATGSSAFVPGFEGLDTVKDKFTFMCLDDAEGLGSALGTDSSKKVLIVGAGLIGLKCAEGILSRASTVTLVDLAPNVLSSILDKEGAKIVEAHLEENGMKFILGHSVASFDGSTATLDNGDKISFDILVLAVGVRPNTALLSGIADIDRGIKINSRSETSAKDIYAAGDCTQTTDVSSGQSRIMALLPNAYMQGECAGVNMAGGDKSFDKAIPMNAIGFYCAGSALHVITAGSYTGNVYAQSGETASDYKRLFYEDNRLSGYILIGDIEKAGIYTSLIREQTPLDSIDFELICEKPGLMAFTKDERQAKLGRTTQ